jgi:hypothetical protein
MRDAVEDGGDQPQEGGERNGAWGFGPWTRVIEDGLVDDADQLRNRATRLFALAQKAREEGHLDYAEELTRLAIEAVGQAVTMERRRIAHSEMAH